MTVEEARGIVESWFAGLAGQQAEAQEAIDALIAAVCAEERAEAETRADDESEEVMALRDADRATITELREALNELCDAIEAPFGYQTAVSTNLGQQWRAARALLARLETEDA
jgi:hypothetical protein